MRSVISEVHAPGNDIIQICSTACGRRNSVKPPRLEGLTTNKALPLLRQSLMIQSYFVTHVFVAAQVR